MAKNSPAAPTSCCAATERWCLCTGVFGTDTTDGRVSKCRTEWWEAKIARNAARDAFNRHQLAATGWRVVVVWECALRTVALRAQTLADLERMILGNHPDEGNLTLAA